MPIHHFAGAQNVVFVPALLALLVATVAICAPIVAAPGLRRARRLRPVAIVAGVAAVVALVATGWQAGVAVRRLGTERAAVQADLRDRYGLDLTSGEVGLLVDGGKVERTMPAEAASLGVSDPGKEHTLHLREDADAPGTYVLTFGGKPLPVTA